jgi:putative ABC transport system permease protein
MGASRRDLVTMILREAAMFVVPGLAAGVVFALAFSKVVQSFVYRLSPLDSILLASAARLLVLLIMILAWIPARRAAAVELATALRTS